MSVWFGSISPDRRYLTASLYGRPSYTYFPSTQVFLVLDTMDGSVRKAMADTPYGSAWQRQPLFSPHSRHLLLASEGGFNR